MRLEITMRARCSREIAGAVGSVSGSNWEAVGGGARGTNLLVFGAVESAGDTGAKGIWDDELSTNVPTKDATISASIAMSALQRIAADRFRRHAINIAANTAMIAPSHSECSSVHPSRYARFCGSQKRWNVITSS